MKEIQGVYHNIQHFLQYYNNLARQCIHTRARSLSLPIIPWVSLLQFRRSPWRRCADTYFPFHPSGLAHNPHAGGVHAQHARVCDLWHAFLHCAPARSNQCSHWLTQQSKGTPTSMLKRIVERGKERKREEKRGKERKRKRERKRKKERERDELQCKGGDCVMRASHTYGKRETESVHFLKFYY